MNNLATLEELAGIHPVLEFYLPQIKNGNIPPEHALCEMLLHVSLALKESQTELDRLRDDLAKAKEQRYVDAVKQAVEVLDDDEKEIMPPQLPGEPQSPEPAVEDPMPENVTPLPERDEITMDRIRRLDDQPKKKAGRGWLW